MLLLGAYDPQLNHPRHRAEAYVANLISESFGGPNADDRWIAFYGVHVRQLTLPRDTEVIDGITEVDQLRELDFLVFDRTRGYAVLEVKGGRLRLSRGGWQRFAPPDQREQSDRASSDNAATVISEGADSEMIHAARGKNMWVPANDPMAQARTAEYNLHRRLEERLGSRLFKGNPLWHSHAVLMPDVDSTHGGMPLDWNKFVMASREQLASPSAFEEWLEGHFQYVGQSHTKRTSDRTTALITRILNDCIMPPFSADRSARKQVARLIDADERAMEGCTPIHEFVRSKLRRDSVLIEGAAGTGKTHAATLRAMHELESRPDARVLYVCFNELLAEHVSSGPAARFEGRFTALPFRALCERECARAGVPWTAAQHQGDRLTDFYRDEAPRLLTGAAQKSPLAPNERPTMLIIDEAQDFNEAWLEAIDALTGRDCIRWCLYDPAQLLFGNLALEVADGQPTETAADLSIRLAQRFGKPDLMLRNQRLSVRVFEFLRQKGILPHQDLLLDPNALEGFDPTEMQVAGSYARKAIHNAIIHAIDELQFAPDQILVQAAVTPSNAEHPLHRPAGEWTGGEHDPWDVAGRYRLARIEDGDALPADAIEMATAQKFKGCERPYSIVIKTPMMNAARFYTACTRARLGLAIIDVVS